MKKPRILVSAPSNAAVDEIIMRLMKNQFVDGNGIKYRPSIIRIGVMEKFREQVSVQVSLNSRIEAFLKHKYNKKYDMKTNIKGLNDRINIFQKEKIKWETKLCNLVSNHLKLFGKQNFHEFKLNPNLNKIIGCVTEINTKRLEIQRLLWVRDFDKNKAKEMLMRSELINSEIIFVTLNSAGGNDLRLLLNESEYNYNSNNDNNLFDHCIIDEAGQCTEPDILIPLIYNINSVVLVGDPQQLPATVFSHGPSSWLYERSLFERLMANGYPVNFLKIQYRMHYEISKFPNKHFYNNKLMNGDGILSNQYNKIYHKEMLFKPLLYFNIKNSNEIKNRTSLWNLDEIKFIIAHLKLFYSIYTNPSKYDNNVINEINKLSVGIITPYKQQRNQISKFIDDNELLKSKNIEVATVDFYQGREKDIIIFSCVRAGGKYGIGFLSDIRRMNVAITRAKYCLWIVGNEVSLNTNPDWSKLLNDIKDRMLYINILWWYKHNHYHYYSEFNSKCIDIHNCNPFQYLKKNFNNNNYSNNYNNGITCYNCGLKGHRMNQCRKERKSWNNNSNNYKNNNNRYRRNNENKNNGNIIELNDPIQSIMDNKSILNNENNNNSNENNNNDNITYFDKKFDDIFED